MMPNNQNMNTGCCGCGRTCPCQVNPIVLPERVCTVNRCYQYEQPIVVPTHTRIVNHFYPTPRYYPSFTTSEEDVCHGTNNNTNTNM